MMSYCPFKENTSKLVRYSKLFNLQQVTGEYLKHLKSLTPIYSIYIKSYYLYLKKRYIKSDEVFEGFSQAYNSIPGNY